MENTFYNDFDVATPSAERRRDDEYRSGFQISRDRILHTSAFRRLQGKTQVFLTGEYDFYRTRLTHSLEVSQIGRSICAALRSRSPHLGADHFIDPDLVEAACLAHDLGHPPFGHAGERSLHYWMKGQCPNPAIDYRDNFCPWHPRHEPKPGAAGCRVEI